MVPQGRTRFFLVGIRADSLRRKFNWPQPCPPVSASSVFDRFNPKTDKAGRLPSTKRGKTLVKTACTAVFKKTGKDPRTIPVLIDVDCSDKYATFGIDEAKTITRTRGGTGGPWVSSRGRRVNTNELLRLQGFNPARIPWQEIGVTKRQIGQLIGNSVCPPVLGMALSEALYSAGLTATKLI